jgi:hypothetical protein
MGSIPRRAERRFRASQATHPPPQGSLSAKIANAMFLSADRGLDTSIMPRRFRASGSCRTHPPPQGSLSAKIANAMFLSADRGARFLDKCPDVSGRRKRRALRISGRSPRRWRTRYSSLRIMGSIPRRAERRFRASQATHPPHQGSLSAKITNAMFLSADRGLDSSAFPSSGGLELIFLARYARHSAQGATQRIDSTDQFLTLEIFSAKLPP